MGSTSRFKGFTYLGHSAVLIESSEAVIAIDPWLEGNPLCPAAQRSPGRIDLIVLTHGHADHASDALRLSKLCGAKIAATYELAMILAAEGVSQDKLIAMNKGGSIETCGHCITLTHALHSSSFDSPTRGTLYAGEACGVVIQDNSTAIYHSGDTALFSDMKLIGQRFRPRYAFLSIGDRFTMGPQEGSQAAALIGASTVFPIHHSTFDLLTGKPAELQAALAPNFKMVELKPGQSYEIN